MTNEPQMMTATVFQPFLELCEEILEQQKGEGDHSTHLDTTNSHMVDLNKPSIRRQDSADTQMEKGEGEQPAKKGWCCSVL